MFQRRRRYLELLEKCRNLDQLKQTHSQLIRCGFKDDSFALSRILALCALPIHGSLPYAWQLFRNIQTSTTCICNTMMRAFLTNGIRFWCFSFRIYSVMLANGIHPDPYTFSYMLQASMKNDSIFLGLSVHGAFRKSGLIMNNFIGNDLLSLYTNFGYLKCAQHVFDEIISGFSADVVSWTLMISGYGKLGDVEMAKSLFEQAACKDLGVWGAMVSSYMHNNCPAECLHLLHLMQTSGILPDEGIWTSMLSACAQLGDLEIGAWIHKYLEKIRFPYRVKVQTALIDMYAKSGRLDIAKEIFFRVENKDVVCWNAMIFAMAWHGNCDGALELFSQMEQTNCRPDDLTFLAVLTACSNTGLGKECLALVNKMLSMYGIKLKGQHYGCVVKLLGRVGLLEEAAGTVATMASGSSWQILEEAVAWRALINSCLEQGQIKLAELAASRSAQLDGNNNAYILLANWFASADRQEDANRVREMVRNRGFNKSPGCSTIQG